MAKRALVIEVQLLTGRYHGVGDWPPSPFRLFQALVSGAYGGRWVAEPDEDKDKAFRWFERLAPPWMVAPGHIRGRAVHTFVPNNDLDAVGGDPSRIAEIRAQKQTQPSLLTDDLPFVYAWLFEEEDTSRASEICTLAERLHTFGRGVDSAFARARTADWNVAREELSQLGSVSVPSASADRQREVRCPAPGSLQSLMTRYARWTKRLDRSPDRTASTLFRQPPRARCAVVAYDRPATRHVFDILPSEGATTFRALPQVRAVEVATAVRDLAFDRLSHALPDRTTELEHILIGRGTPPPDPLRRVRFVPLPSTGSRHADAAIRRVLVELPPECPFTSGDIAWSLSGQSLAPFSVVEKESGELRVDAMLVPSADDSTLRHYGVSRSARKWRTVTPAALPRRAGSRRLGSARAAVEDELARTVIDALRHVGLPYRGVQVHVQGEPFTKHGSPAPAFASGRFRAETLHHVEVVFPRPVHGPLVIGDGRWLGLGVMAPVSEPPPSVHVYRISGGTWSVSNTALITQALRRAVMSRAGAEAGPRRQLPVFFTGHQATAEPVRGEHHGHLFYLAHDADGDGALDHVAVVAPHVADRRADSSASVSDRGLLARALDGLQAVRAGRLGVLELTPVKTPPKDLFGLSATWESVTMYRPTRHPKRRMTAEEALVADVKTETVRRGLPAPDVTILEMVMGPKGGLRCRARLTFSNPVSGPLILGPGSHFGEGLFSVVMKE